MSVGILLLLTVGTLAVQSSVNLQQDDDVTASDGWTNYLPGKSEGHPINYNFVKNSSDCAFPFERIGSNCYHFSNVELNFDDAIDYCENLAIGHAFDVTLAMLEYDVNEDQLLLDAAVARQKTFWIGGKTEDSVYWEWLDNREMFLNAPIWEISEPNEVANKCAVAQVTTSGNNIRSHLYDYECSESIHFICQTRFHFNFRRIGLNYYLFSEEVGLPRAYWNHARAYCQSLAVPLGYHADLAVFGRSDQDSYHLMSSFPTNAWVGAYTDTNDCNFKWVDGRSFDDGSYYWRNDEPSYCENGHVVILERLSSGRTQLVDWDTDHAYPFVCQMFRN